MSATQFGYTWLVVLLVGIGIGFLIHFGLPGLLANARNPVVISSNWLLVSEIVGGIIAAIVAHFIYILIEGAMNRSR